MVRRDDVVEHGGDDEAADTGGDGPQGVPSGIAHHAGLLEFPRHGQLEVLGVERGGPVGTGQPGDLPVLQGALPDEAGDGQNPVAGRVSGDRRLGQVLAVATHHRRDQLLAVADVPVDRRRGNAQFGGQSAHRQGVGTLGLDQGDGTVEDLGGIEAGVTAGPGCGVVHGSSGARVAVLRTLCDSVQGSL